MTSDEAHSFYHIDEEVPSELDLVGGLIERYRDQAPLAGSTALLFQHQLANQVPMVRALVALGLDPGRIHWVDIPYTSHASVRDMLISLGVPASNFRTCSDFEPLTPYAPYQRKRSVQVLSELRRTRPESLLVLDDGAYFAEAASCFDSAFERCSVVEQTSRGFKKTAKNAAMARVLAGLPTIDVARSTPKSMLESPFIGAAVCASIVHHLEQKLSELDGDARFIVFGFGNIGEAVANALASIPGFSAKNVFVCDPFREIEVNTSGFTPWSRDQGGTFDLVIGCSGTTSFDVGDYVFLEDGAVLVSASSGAVEFNRRNVVEWAGADLDDDLAIGEYDKNDIHGPIPIHFPNRDVILLNGGFPANFDGRVTCLPYRYIQISMALMVLGSVQAALATKVGVQDLYAEPLQDITREYYRDLEGDQFAGSVLPTADDVLAEIGRRHPGS